MLQTLIMSTHVQTLQDMVGEAMCRAMSLRARWGGGGVIKQLGREFSVPNEVFAAVPHVHSIVES